MVKLTLTIEGNRDEPKIAVLHDVIRSLWANKNYIVTKTEFSPDGNTIYVFIIENESVIEPLKG